MSTNPTPQPDLDAIADRLAKITPGKWHVNHGDDRLCMNTFYVATTKTDDDPCEVYEDVVCVTLYQAERCASHRAYRWEEDAEFIAAAPADIAALLEYARRLESLAKEAEAQRDWLARQLAMKGNCHSPVVQPCDEAPDKSCTKCWLNAASQAREGAKS